MITRISQFNRPFKRTKLDDLNDKRRTRQLHPTKGFRKTSLARSVAALITAEMQNGKHYSTSQIKDDLQDARNQ